MSNPIVGASYFLHGLKLIFKPGIRFYVIIPLLINLVLFGLLIAFGVNYFSSWIDGLLPKLPEWLQWLSWLMWILFALATILIVFFLFSLLTNIIGAPFNGLLAEAVEHYLTGEKPSANSGWKQFLSELGPSLKNEVKKLVYLVAWSIPLFILFFIPLVQLVAPFIWMIFSSWMLAMEYADYPMSNHGLKLPEVRQKLGEKRLMSLGFGGMVMLATMIPVGNFFVMPVAVAGATAYWVQQLRKR